MTAKVTNCKLGFLTSEQRGMCLQGPPGEKTGTFLNFSLSAGGSASLKGQRKLQFPFSKFSNSLAGRFGGNSCSPESPTDLPNSELARDTLESSALLPGQCPFWAWRKYMSSSELCPDFGATSVRVLLAPSPKMKLV